VIAGALEWVSAYEPARECARFGLPRAGGERSLARDVALWRPEAADKAPELLTLGS